MLSQTMSDLDIDPRKAPIPRLMAIIQKLNLELDNAQAQLTKERQRVEREHAYLKEVEIRYHKYFVKYLCEECQLHIRSTPPGDTISFCETCDDTSYKVRRLKGENQQLRRELETYRNHEGHVDGTSQCVQ